MYNKNRLYTFFQMDFSCNSYGYFFYIKYTISQITISSVLLLIKDQSVL